MEEVVFEHLSSGKPKGGVMGASVMASVIDALKSSSSQAAIRQASQSHNTAVLPLKNDLRRVPMGAQFIGAVTAASAVGVSMENKSTHGPYTGADAATRSSALGDLSLSRAGLATGREAGRGRLMLRGLGMIAVRDKRDRKLDDPAVRLAFSSRLDAETCAAPALLGGARRALQVMC